MVGLDLQRRNGERPEREEQLFDTVRVVIFHCRHCGLHGRKVARLVLELKKHKICSVMGIKRKNIHGR